MQTTHTYTAVFNKDTPQQGLTLKKEKHNIFCINRQPIITQGDYGKLNIDQISCGTNCPFANVTKNDAGDFIYEVSCKTHIKQFTLDNVEELEKYFAPTEEKLIENKKPGLIVV